MAEAKPTRFELRLPVELGAAIDDWRRQQPDLPPRAEAARRLIEIGLSKADSAPKREKPRKRQSEGASPRE